MPGGVAEAQNADRTVRIYNGDNPASMSIQEEGTNSAAIPMMSVFNNRVLYEQHKAQNSLDGIAPNLAESWLWNEGDPAAFELRPGRQMV
jgi:peptide/nickel transport system substrate-binding protein